MFKNNTHRVNLDFLRHCTPEQIAVVNANASCSQYKKGQIIFHEGGTPAGIFCMNSGVVKLVRTNNDGKEQILRFAQTGDIMGFRAVIADEALVASAICVEDANVCFIPSKIFMDLIDTVPAISKDLLKSICHDLGVTEERVQSLAQKSVRERLAETLLFLNATFNDSNEDIIHITLPREDIANIVGTATETVIRLLSEFKQDKLIEVEGKKIKLLDKEKLNKISRASV